VLEDSLATLARKIRDCLASSERAFEIALFKVRVLTGHRSDFAVLVSPDLKDIYLVAPSMKRSNALPLQSPSSMLMLQGYGGDEWWLRACFLCAIV